MELGIQRQHGTGEAVHGLSPVLSFKLTPSIDNGRLVNKVMYVLQFVFLWNRYQNKFYRATVNKLSTYIDWCYFQLSMWKTKLRKAVQIFLLNIKKMHKHTIQKQVHMYQIISTICSLRISQVLCHKTIQMKLIYFIKCFKTKQNLHYEI